LKKKIPDYPDGLRHLDSGGLEQLEGRLDARLQQPPQNCR